jgi:hypothetical protein
MARQVFQGRLGCASRRLAASPSVSTNIFSTAAISARALARSTLENFPARPLASWIESFKASAACASARSIP